jgi:NAD(P)-dependent dehydrogenase (short-subunit alcohol dehydrogenase family)
MQGKICLITGATNGIGKAVALALARAGATVVIVGRSLSRTAAVVQELKLHSGSDTIENRLADLSRPAEVRHLAESFKAQYKRLDVLVNNAGALFNQRHETPEGLEMSFALNHRSYFLLTNLLMDELKAGAAAAGTPARVVNVSAGAHFGAHLDFNDLQGKKRYNGFSAYAASKLANVLFTYELARRVDPNEITANAVHPGVVATGFAKNGLSFTGLFFTVFAPFLLTPEQGAETPLYLAASPEVEGVTGKYFLKKRAVKSSFVSYDEASARHLWKVSEQWLTAQAAW